jgi:SAM-dependent methyltransferase
MDSALNQLKELAAAAAAHAKYAHGKELAVGDYTTADAILHHERSLATDSDHAMLAACYGAWIGQAAIQEYSARWIGLHESQSPRLLVGGVMCSPIDAVKRMLCGEPAPISLAVMAKKMAHWAAQERAFAVQEKVNERAWDRLADDVRFAGEMPLPESAEMAQAALDPWLMEIWRPDLKLMCLGAGGGRQGPLHALAGADVTVVDLSRRQLEHDRMVAQKHGLNMTLLQASAEHLVEIEDKTFDVVLQPVSACYLKNIPAMYAEVARVLKPGGIYLVQHKQPLSLLVQGAKQGGVWIEQPQVQGKPLAAIAEDAKAPHPTRELGTVEYAHSLQSLIGDLCSAGFLIAQFSEPPRADAFAAIGTAEHFACFIPPYMKLKAIHSSQAKRS